LQPPAGGGFTAHAGHREAPALQRPVQRITVTGHHQGKPPGGGGIGFLQIGKERCEVLRRLPFVCCGNDGDSRGAVAGGEPGVGVGPGVGNVLHDAAGGG
jgi:hypothetical protein